MSDLASGAVDKDEIPEVAQDGRWRQVLARCPDAIAYAVDRSGMVCCFTGPAQYHDGVGRWMPGQGVERHDMGLAPTAPNFDPAASLTIKPGQKDAYYKMQSEAISPPKDLPRDASPQRVDKVEQPVDPFERDESKPQHGAIPSTDPLPRTNVEKERERNTAIRRQIEAEKAKETPAEAPLSLVETAKILAGAVEDIAAVIPKTKQPKVARARENIKELLERLS